MDDAFVRVKQVFLIKFDIPEEKFVPQASLESLGLDSLDSLEVLFDLEDEFQVRIPQDRAQQVKVDTVQDLVDSMRRLAAEQAKPGTAEQTA